MAAEMTDEECKALFAMLDEECDGVLNRINFLNMGEAIGFEFAEHHLDMAMAAHLTIQAITGSSSSTFLPRRFSRSSFITRTWSRT